MSNDSMVVLHCACGETYFAAEQHLGNYINCSCGRDLFIARSPLTAKYNAAFNAEPDFRAGINAARKSFSARSALRVVFGLACLLIGLKAFVGYYQERNPVNAVTTSVMSATPSPAATIQPTPGANHNFDNNRSVDIPRNFFDPEYKPVSLKNGVNITPPQGPRGNKYLTIINEDDSDVAVKLVENTTGKTRRFFYVRANSRATVRGIGNEECRVIFSTGADWDAENRKFRSNAAYSEFKTVLNFRRISYLVSLKPTIKGTVPVDSIGEEEFADK